MPAKVICMASAKGGSGKTVLTATFAEFLSKLGKRVLCVDVDAATNGLTLLYSKEVMFQGEFAMGEKRRPLGVFDVDYKDNTLEGRLFFGELIELSNGVSLFPATYHFKNTESCLVENFRETLGQLFTAYDEEFDFILLDAQAGMDPFAAIAMSRDVSNEVVIVSEYDPMSAAGVERLKAMFREDLTYPRTWILLNKMLPEFVQSFSDFLQVANYLSPIPWNSDVVLAYARRRLALDFEDGNSFTLAIVKTAKSLFGDSVSEEISRWLEDKTNELLRPLEENYRNKERALIELRQQRIIEKRDMSRKALSASFNFVFGIAFVLGIVYLIVFQIRSYDFPELPISATLLAAILSLMGMFGLVAASLGLKGMMENFRRDKLDALELDRKEELLMKDLDKLKEKIDSDIDELLRK